MSVIGPILALLILTPLSFLALSALFSALILLFPGPVGQARENLENRPWRSIFLGTLNFIGGGFIVMLVVGLGMVVGQDIGAASTFLYALIGLIGIVLAIPTLIGLSAVIIVIGERIGKARNPFLTYLRGGGLLLLACITPFVGWFVFTPLVIWASLGSVVAILVKPKKVLTEKADEPSAQLIETESQPSPTAS
jgi:hypothetical protein